jgi:signal transduction histidine kinase
VVHRNAAAERGLPGGEDLATVLQAPEGEAAPDWPAAMDALADGPAVAGTGPTLMRNVPLVKPGGRRMLADLQFSDLGEADGEKLVLVAAWDVSARVCMERRLAATERLAGVADRSGQLAHELSNPLDGVLRYLGLAERAAGDEAAGHLDGARRGLERMAETIRALQGAGDRGGDLQPVAALLSEAANVMQPRADAMGVTVACDFDGCTATAGAELFQVFCNVIKNALDAMPDGGLLTVRGRPRQGQCVVEFLDTGYGVTELECRRMFEPFYTTKPAAEGSGLGLAISREIVARAGGTIAASPRREGGTAVTVRLPVGERAVTTKAE